MPRYITFDAVRIGDVFAERYHVVRPIKAGGMGAVFEVQHVRTHRAHALKVMHPDVVARRGARERFEQEAYVGTRIDSPNVVVVNDAGVDAASGLPFLVMELLVGEELADVIERDKRIAPKRTIKILRAVAHALDNAHKAGIIHRDLKPENIFILAEPQAGVEVKVLDFGIAK
ncbi:MAG: serine/threonine-protein kinase, partial [Polyangiales bacterium]